MNLSQLVTTIDQLEPQCDIYAASPWSAASFAILLPEDAERPLIKATAGQATYLMSVETARDLVSQMRAESDPSLEELCRVLIYHAVYDTPPPRGSQPGSGRWREPTAPAIA